MVLLSFAVTFYVAPDADQRWEWITPGSLLGTAAFLAASLAFRYYIEKFTHYDKTYGSLGGVMVLMFWFWISSVCPARRAQMNQVIEDRLAAGQAVRPAGRPGASPPTWPTPSPVPPARPKRRGDAHDAPGPGLMTTRAGSLVLRGGRILTSGS